MSIEDLCWLNGSYTDDCCCDLCSHRTECSASSYPDDDDFDDWEDTESEFE